MSLRPIDVFSFGGLLTVAFAVFCILAFVALLAILGRAFWRRRRS